MTNDDSHAQGQLPAARRPARRQVHLRLRLPSRSTASPSSATTAARPGYEGQIDIYPHNDDVVIVLTNQDQVMVPAIQQSENLLTVSATPSTTTPPSRTPTTSSPSSSTPTTSPPSSSTTTPGNSPADKAHQYVECMRSHGESNFPESVNGYITLSPSSGINPNSPQYQAAQQACQSFAPSGQRANRRAWARGLARQPALPRHPIAEQT